MLRQARDHGAVGEQNGRFRLFEHVGRPGRRRLGVDRHPGRAGADHRKEGHHQLDGALQAAFGFAEELAAAHNDVHDDERDLLISLEDLATTLETLVDEYSIES